MSTPQIPTPMYPGIDPDANEGSYINALSISFVALSFVTVCLRLFSRWWTKIEFGTDDWLILVAAVFSWVFSAILIVEVENDFYGQHIGKSDLMHLRSYMKALYAIIILYPLALTFSKLSLLALYWRIFRGSSGQIPIILAVFANVAWMIISSMLGVFICIPIRGFWDFSVKSKCKKYNASFISAEAFTITLDIIVLVMPVYFIASIKRSFSQRVSISSTFLLGLIATIISCIRLWRLVRSQQRPGFDPTCPYYNEIDGGVWGAVEVNLWVTVASFPTLRPMWGKIKRDRQESRKSNLSRAYVNSSGSGYKAKFGHSGGSKGTTLPSSDNQDRFGVEEYNVLVHSNYRDGESTNVGRDENSDHYELGIVNHGIRVHREVEVSRPERILQIP